MILQQCPICNIKIAVKNKLCKCGCNLDSKKKQGKIRYWIQYRLPGGKQRKEFIRDPENIKNKGSYEDAVAAHGKRLSQKKEDRIMDMLPGSKITIAELSKWYLNQYTVKKLKTYKDVVGVINIFNRDHASLLVIELKQTIIEEYQGERQRQGKAPSTIDKEIRMIKTMVKKGFDNDKIDGRALKAFNNINKLLDKGENARGRTFTHSEYVTLLHHAVNKSFKDILTVAYNTGMRAGEIEKLQHSHYDKSAGVLRLPKTMTKEKKAKIIPVIGIVKTILSKAIRCTHHDYIFYSSSNNPYNKWSFVKLFKQTCFHAKISYGQKIKEGATFHDIRRTVKTNMLEAEVDKTYRDLILGHTLKGMDQYYIKPDESKLIKEMTKYTTWLNDKLADVTLNVTLKQKSS